MMPSVAKLALGPKFVGGLDYIRYLGRRVNKPLNGQEFRKHLFLDLLHSVPFARIFETGAYLGSTAKYFSHNSGLPVYSTELDPRFYGFAKTRLLFNRKITLHNEDSRAFLKHYSQERQIANEPAFFYLDAHWNNDLPLREEILIIFSSRRKAVVMIDDFKVPFDDGYGWDCYGKGNELTLDYLGSLHTLKLEVFFPSCPSANETGAKRGCAVLARDRAIIRRLLRLESLVRFEKPAL